MRDDAARQRAFVADVAHDLQSPLTGMRTQLEVALARSGSETVESWVRSMLAATTEMELLVSNLLALASEERRTNPCLASSSISMHWSTTRRSGRGRTPWSRSTRPR